MLRNQELLIVDGLVELSVGETDAGAVFRRRRKARDRKPRQDRPADLLRIGAGIKLKSVNVVPAPRKVFLPITHICKQVF